ncbi:MAG: hypothetical protein VX946_07225 [Pseudomonadota bacterium]|nr:hypothetical protein [Pseudomonadota bacterium]
MKITRLIIEGVATASVVTLAVIGGAFLWAALTGHLILCTP